MKILEIIKITNEANIIYAKTTLRNLLKKRVENRYESFLIFSLMELSSNLLKHASGGEIWIIESDSKILLAALDYGEGIKDIAWSMKNGTSRMINSLGLGLHQMNNDTFYHIEVASFTDTDMHGTVVLVKPRNWEKDVLSAQISYVTESICGDIFVKKGRFLLLADGSGHGKKANISVELIKSYFYKHPFSCILVDEFFSKIHDKLKSDKLRGAVVSIFEVSNSSIQACGVGNISYWHQDGNGYQYSSQKDGILGEVFSSSDTHIFNLSRGSKLIAATDGIGVGAMNKVLSKLSANSSSAMLALCAMHFAAVSHDDKTIVIITQKGKKNE